MNKAPPDRTLRGHLRGAARWFLGSPDPEVAWPPNIPLRPSRAALLGGCVLIGGVAWVLVVLHQIRDDQRESLYQIVRIKTEIIKSDESDESHEE